MITRILFVCLFSLSLWVPRGLMASHPSTPQAVERIWTDALSNRIRDMSNVERSEWRQRIRAEYKQFKQKKKAGEETDVNKFLLTLIALILPPLAVYLHQGEINSKFWISLLLTLLIWVPGVVYALLVIFGIVP